MLVAGKGISAYGSGCCNVRDRSTVRSFLTLSSPERMSIRCTGALLVWLAVASSAAAPSSSQGPNYADMTPVGAPVTVNFSSFQIGSDALPETDPALARTRNATEPDQIHISIGGNVTEMYVTWVTGDAAFYASNPVAPPTMQTMVNYGTAPGRYTLQANGTSLYYLQNNTGKVATTSNSIYVSGLIHTTLMQSLEPNTTYFYQVGDPEQGLSAEQSFKTGLAPSAVSFPNRIGLVADLGLTSNSTVTLSHLVANEPEMVIFVGDLCYSDAFSADGQSIYHYLAGEGAGKMTIALPAASYQPRWDALGRFLERSGNASSIAYMTVTGNHEIERDSNGEVFKSWSARYPTPFRQSKASSNLYYSFDYGGAHYINIAAYDGPGPGKQGKQYLTSTGVYPHTIISQEQLAWIQQDLAAVNRSVTPWIVAQFHPPYYNTYTAHYKEVECFQQQVETLLYQYGVSFVFNGHVHAYERTNQVFAYELNPCGPTYVIIGDGGNVEGTYKTFVDTDPGQVSDKMTQACNKSISELNATGSRPPLCATAQVYQPGGPPQYCPTQQPYYSAFREPSFGHGILELKSAYEATFTWYRNQDGNPIPRDTVTVVRNTTCPNQFSTVSSA